MNDVMLLRRPRRLMRALLWMTLATLMLISIPLMEAWILWDMTGWREWFDAHAVYFLIWRLCLYGVTLYGWLWVRRLVRDLEARQRLSRAAIGALAALVLLELSALLT